jgi:hypothetical protein
MAQEAEAALVKLQHEIFRTCVSDENGRPCPLAVLKEVCLSVWIF